MDRAELLKRLAQAGVKHTPENILIIAARSDSSIVFLERGNIESGWQHIKEEHSQDFYNTGITESQIIDLVMQAVICGKIIAIQGRSRTVYEVEFNGIIQYIAVEIASNGYIVSANPISENTKRRLLRRNAQ